MENRNGGSGDAAQGTNGAMHRLAVNTCQQVLPNQPTPTCLPHDHAKAPGITCSGGRATNEHLQSLLPVRHVETGSKIWEGVGERGWRSAGSRFRIEPAIPAGTTVLETLLPAIVAGCALQRCTGVHAHCPVPPNCLAGCPASQPLSYSHSPASVHCPSCCSQDPSQCSAQRQQPAGQEAGGAGPV